MNKILRRGAVAAVLTAASALSLPAQVTINLDAASRGPRIGALHYGIFYEEINNAGDGGIYAELLRNRSFEYDFNTGRDKDWATTGSASAERIRANLLNDAQLWGLRLKLTGADAGLINHGYWGINAVKDDIYTLTFWIKSDAGWKGTATASLVNAKDQTVVAATVTTPEINADAKWQKVEAQMTASATDPDCIFKLTFSNSGTLELDVVSLFPPTYKDRPNGMRRDLAEMLAALKPAFVRFPGGCFIEGSGSEDDNRRFEWKKTIGPIEERPGHYNYNWGYPCTDGMGFHEFLQLTEDLGAEPLFVVNIGLGHGYAVDYTQIDEYIREALDALEYCNGDVTTEWGAKRAANGHPEPFNMRLIEIGNENYNYDDITSDHYAERYKAFYDAIKAAYPQVICIGNVEAWGTDNPTWRNSYPCEVVDEHYYRHPEWFVNQYNKYDTYDRAKPKVYVGEYAVTKEFGTNGSLRAALGEAVYMLGMERNSDIVIMNSYAPIFMNEERDGGWMPDMIRFSHDKSYGTPSYWVQSLMPNNVGKQNVNWTEEGNLEGSGSRIALSSWSTKVSYDNVKVTDADGNVLFTDDFTSPESNDWKATTTNWKRQNGTLVQTSSSEQGRFYAGLVDFPGTYTLELDAVKESGAEGFLVGFNYADDYNYCWWNIGGWNNGQHGLQVCNNNVKTDIDLKAGSVAAGQTYHIRIEVDGTAVKCYLNDKLIHNVVLPIKRRVYVASAIDDEAKEMIVKIVNFGGTDVDVNLNMANAGMDSADVIVLTSASNADENSTDNPENIVPKAGSMKSVENSKAVYEAPAYSLSILRIKLGSIDYTPQTGQPATEAQIAKATAELYPTFCKLNFLHATTSLPVTTASGSTIEWSFKEPASKVALSTSIFSTILDVLSPNKGNAKETVATLVATVTFADGAEGEIEIPVNLAPADSDAYGYLYAFMNPATEETNYALGTKEGLAKQFTTLNGGNEVFDTKTLAPIEQGTRDPYLGRGRNADEYFMATTDMCNRNSGAWSNHGIDLLRSSDLVHWESTAFDFHLGKKIFSDPEATVEDFPTDADYAKMTQVWAPQFIWDETANNGRGAYLVYYSLLAQGMTHQNIYYSYTTDFKTLTQPRVFYAPGYPVIDTDLYFSEYDGLYHMMIKKEAGADVGIFEYTSPTLMGNDWTEILHMAAEGNAAVEGPTTIRRIDEDVYNLSYMRYDAEYKYKVVELDHMGLNYSTSTPLVGDGNFQHGSIIYVNEDEYNMLKLWSEVKVALRKAENIRDSEGSTVFDEAIALANSTLESNLTVSSLLENLPAALDALLNANAEYIAADPDSFNDLTSMIANPHFANNTTVGWSGTTLTAAADHMAEQYDKTFNTYQDLPNMPAGNYVLYVQGFYRFGLNGKPAHDNGTEELLASYYINDSELPFMSLYDEDMLTFPNNTYSAGRAFNVNNRYNNKEVKYYLPEMGTIRIGVKKTTPMPQDWTAFDNFRLYYKPGEESGIDEVPVDWFDGEAVYYDLNGVRVANPAHGNIYIKKAGSRSEKVLLVK